MEHLKDFLKLTLAITAGILLANQITPLVTKAKS